MEGIDAEELLVHFEWQEGTMAGHSLENSLGSPQSARSLGKSLFELKVARLESQHVLHLQKINLELFEVGVAQFLDHLVNLRISLF